MINGFHSHQFNVRQCLGRSLTITVLSIVSLLAGIVPTLGFHSPTHSLKFQFSTVAVAQAVTDEERQNYARSLLAIEPIRQQAYDAIKRILGSGQVPPIACHRPNSLNNLNANIRQIAINYCNRAIQIVERNNLTINRFNRITVQMQNDPNLVPLIQQEMIRLQQAQ